MVKQFTEAELQEMNQSFMNRIKYMHKQQIELLEFKKYFKVTNKVVDSLTDKEYLENFELLEQIENKLNLFYIDVSPMEFNSVEFARLKYLIRQLFYLVNQSMKLNFIIFEKNPFQLLDTFIQ